MEILSGWKDIAQYMRKGVRTVQRYERELALPIRRPCGGSKGGVIATRVEIDAWVKTCALQKEFEFSRPTKKDAMMATDQLRQQLQEMRRLRQEAAQLLSEVAESRKAMHTMIDSLQQSLRQVVVAEEGEPDYLRLSAKRRVTADVLFDPKRKVN